MKNDEILPLYLSKRIISIFDLKPQLKVVAMPKRPKTNFMNKNLKTPFFMMK
jgi:hypothetical protein